MSIRNQLMTAAQILGEVTPELLVTEVRKVIVGFEDPNTQDDHAFPTADGQWLTVAEIKEHFGPNYATSPIVIEQVLAVYAGRLIQVTVEQVGLDVQALRPLQISALMMVITLAEQQALVRMTTN